MQDIIRRILDVDRQAQAITDQARREKQDSEREVAAKVQQFREEQLARARERIQSNRDMEQAIAQKAGEKQEERYQHWEAWLDTLYARKHKEWVNELVSRVLDPEL